MYTLSYTYRCVHGTWAGKGVHTPVYSDMQMPMSAYVGQSPSRSGRQSQLLASSLVTHCCLEA